MVAPWVRRTHRLARHHQDLRLTLGGRAYAVAKAETLIVDYYLCGDTLIIASATTPGRLYVVTSTECTCPLGLQEWPRDHATLRLHLLMSRLTPQVDTLAVDAVLQ